jgi:hypothetical protein
MTPKTVILFVSKNTSILIAKIAHSSRPKKAKTSYNLREGLSFGVKIALIYSNAKFAISRRNLVFSLRENSQKAGSLKKELKRRNGRHIIS